MSKMSEHNTRGWLVDYLKRAVVDATAIHLRYPSDVSQVRVVSIQKTLDKVLAEGRDAARAKTSKQET